MRTASNSSAWPSQRTVYLCRQTLRLMVPFLPIAGFDLVPSLFFHSAPNLVVAFSQAHQHQLTPGFRAIEALGVYLSVGALGL